MAESTKPPTRRRKPPEGISPESLAVWEADDSAVYDPVGDYPERPDDEALIRE